MADSVELARGIGHFKIATFSRLSGISNFVSLTWKIDNLYLHIIPNQA